MRRMTMWWAGLMVAAAAIGCVPTGSPAPGEGWTGLPAGVPAAVAHGGAAAVAAAGSGEAGGAAGGEAAAGDDAAAGTCAVRPRPADGFRPARRVPVLMYHHLAPEAAGLHREWRTVIPAELFAQQVEWLAAEGYYTPTLGELLAFVRGEAPLPERSVVLTFDDGYESNLVYAHPVLCRAGLRAAVFVIGGAVRADGTDPAPGGPAYLSWEQLRTMHRSGVWEIANHTWDGHRYVGDRPALLAWGPEEIARDIGRLSAVLADHGLPAPPAVAYPFGAHGAAARAGAAAAGMEMGFTIAAGYAAPGQDSMQLPRLGVFPADGLAGFQEMVTGAWAAPAGP